MHSRIHGYHCMYHSKYITTKLQIFINKSLRKILRIFWPDQITNNKLWKRTKQPKIDLQIRKRKWGWMGHTLWKPMEDIARQAPKWNPQGKWGRGRPKNTWWRTVLGEAKGMKKTWAIKCDAKNRVWWSILVDALCSAAESWGYWLTVHTILYILESFFSLHIEICVVRMQIKFFQSCPHCTKGWAGLL
jgi:hypothetical protein